MAKRGFGLSSPLLFALFSLSACAGQHDSELRLSEQLGEARAEAAFQRAQASGLARRLARVEERVAASSAVPAQTNRALLERLDRLLAQNQRLIAAQAAAAEEPAAAASTAKGAAPAQPAATSAVAKPDTGLERSQEAQLRALVEGWRGRPGRLNGPLTREQNQALRVLTKPERKLDSEALWPGSWY